MKPESTHLNPSFPLLLLDFALLIGNCSTKQAAILSPHATQGKREIKVTSSNYWATETWRTSSPTSMTLDNLLTMTTRLNWNENEMDLYGEPNWVNYVLDLPLIHKPGETFDYCTGCSHVLSVILERTVGMNAETFAKKNLFTALDIINYTWESNPEGSSIGCRGLELTPRDLSKLGYLYLHNGVWEDQKIVSQG